MGFGHGFARGWVGAFRVLSLPVAALYLVMFLQTGKLAALVSLIVYVSLWLFIMRPRKTDRR